MKCTIPEISWHNRDPVLSVDIQPKPQTTSDDEPFITRLASGGTDSHVLIWYIRPADNGTIQLDLASDLSRHQRAVNAVRWSPSGEFLASGDDESIIFIWKMKPDSDPVNILDDNNEQDKESWLIFKTLRGHLEDVYDLSWSLDSTSLISGSVDNTAIVWDVKRGKSRAILNDHKGFVQGVAWDPKNQYLATLSTDRYFRMFDVKTNKVCRRLNKSTYPLTEDSPLYNKNIRLFHDDTLLTFYRRLCFSPDGELIIVPSGIAEVGGESTPGEGGRTKPINTTYIFTRCSTNRPAVVLPSPDQYTVAVRCCPVLFQLRSHTEENPPMIALPYRMIFAVATKSSVYLYDTQQKIPIGLISNIHYARLTDMTWSSDGNILIVSSVDGFCTLITFEVGELGEVYEKPAEEEKVNDIDSNSIEKIDKENIDENVKKTTGTPSTKTEEKKPASTQKAPTRIEIRRTPRVVNGTPATATTSAKGKNTEESKMTTEEGQSAAATQKPKPVVEIQIPDTLIETTEKFESPEYKSRPATPIAIRREPRNTPTATTALGAKVQSSTPNSGTLKSKKATPIAVRRQPRNILPTTGQVATNSVDQDEALDAWPIPIDDKMTSDEPSAGEKGALAELIDVDTMEDMRLVYDGDSELTNINPLAADQPEATVVVVKTVEQPKVTTQMKDATLADKKTPKTPRRVELRTLSTPKSKKKLL